MQRPFNDEFMIAVAADFESVFPRVREAETLIEMLRAVVA